MPLCLKLQTAFSSPVCQGLDAPVVAVSSAVEDNLLDPRLKSLFSQQTADNPALLAFSSRARKPLPDLLRQARNPHERTPGDIVDDLGLDVLQAPADRKPGPLGIPGHLASDPSVTGFQD